jgi:hypothetical protein
MSDDRGPIYIAGLAHSSKTPLRAALGAHPDISMTRRTYMWDRFYGRFGDLADERNAERCLSVMLADGCIGRLTPDPERIRREFREGPRDYAHLFALFHEHHAERLGKRRWGEQLGFVERFSAPIFAAFPSARMIHLVRDPRERSGSTTRRKRGAVGWNTAMWLESAKLAERNRRRYPDEYRVVRYESFVAEPVDTLEELCAFLGEACLPCMREALMDTGVGDGAAPGSVTRPRAGQALSAELAFVDRYARRELSAFDYATNMTDLSRRDRLAFALAERPLNRVTMAAWRLFGGRGAPGDVRSS